MINLDKYGNYLLSRDAIVRDDVLMCIISMKISILITP